MNYEKLPLRLQMAFSSNTRAFSSFLNMDEGAQNEIINESKRKRTMREMNMLVDSISDTENRDK